MPDCCQTREAYFEKCEIVVKAPGLFFWTGEHSVEHGQPAVMQPLNLWLYAGVKLTDNTRCEIDFVHVKPSAPIHSPHLLDAAEHYDCGNDAPGLKESLVHLEEELKRWQSALKIRNGIRLKVYSDVPLAVGLNSSASLSVCLSLIYYYLDKKIAPKKFEELLMRLMYMEPVDLVADPDFKEIFAKALWCDHLVAAHYKSGAAPFASFLRPTKGKEFTLYFTKRRGYGTEIPILRRDLSEDDHKRYIEAMTFWGTRMKTPKLLTNHTYGVSLVYCGSRDNPGGVDQDMFTWHRLDKEKIRRFLKRELGIGSNDDGDFAEPLAEVLSTKRGVESRFYPRYVYANALGAIAWRMIDLLLSVEDQTDKFKQLMIENNKLLKAYGVLRGPLRAFKSRFRILVGEQRFSQLMTKSTGPGNGGLLLVAGEYHDIDEVNKAVDKCMKNDETSGAPQIHYSSLHGMWGIPQDISPIWKAKVTGPIKGTIKIILTKDHEVVIEITREERVLRYILKSKNHFRVLKKLAHHRLETKPRADFCLAWEIYVACVDGLSESQRKDHVATGPPKTSKQRDDWFKKAKNLVTAFANQLRRHDITPSSQVIQQRSLTNTPKDVHPLIKSGWKLANTVEVVDES